MASLAILIRSAPYGTIEAAEGVRHLGGGKALGFERTDGLFCDDGVWALVRGQQPAPGFTSLEEALNALAQAGVRLVAERGSLAEHALEPDDLVPGVEVVDSVDGDVLAADAVLVF